MASKAWIGELWPSKGRSLGASDVLIRVKGDWEKGMVVLQMTRGESRKRMVTIPFRCRVRMAGSLRVCARRIKRFDMSNVVNAEEIVVSLFPDRLQQNRGL